MSAVLDFDLLTPDTVAGAIDAMQANPGAQYLAGGTDLLPNLRRAIGAPDKVISLSGITSLKGISETKTHVVIGAGVTLAELMQSKYVDGFAALKAAGEIAGPALREAATIGGNLCLDTRCLFYNQSKWWRGANQFCLKLDGDTCHVAPKGQRCHAAFSGDLAPALMVLGAEIEIVNRAGSRWQPLDELYVEDGLAHLSLKPGELLSAIRIPLGASALCSAYLKSRLRKAVDFPLAGVAVALSRQGNTITDLRVAVTGTNPRPILWTGLAELIGNTGLNEDGLNAVNKQIGQLIKPMRTTNLPGMYRRQMVAVLTKRLITRLYENGDQPE